MRLYIIRFIKVSADVRKALCYIFYKFIYCFNINDLYTTVRHLKYELIISINCKRLQKQFTDKMFFLTTFIQMIFNFDDKIKKISSANNLRLMHFSSNEAACKLYLHGAKCYLKQLICIICYTFECAHCQIPAIDPCISFH